jgi:hypothetical protein
LTEFLGEVSRSLALDPNETRIRPDRVVNLLFDTKELCFDAVCKCFIELRPERVDLEGIFCSTRGVREIKLAASKRLT